jgi:peptidoglycan-associated lipoprotein
MRILLVLVLIMSIGFFAGCGPKRMRPLESEEEQVAKPPERVREEGREPETPEKPVRPVTPLEDQIDLGHVNFDYDKYNLTDQATKTLAENGAVLMENPSINILIEGHCDERGTEEYNLALGEKRALTARDFLVRFGIAKSRISIISYGEERPMDPGSNEGAWAKNRRAEFVLK